jgi:hypothetical protein
MAADLQLLSPQPPHVSRRAQRNERVNVPNIKTPDNGLLLLIFPDGTSQFTLYDGTEIQCEVK